MTPAVAAVIPVFDPEPGLEMLCAALLREFPLVLVIDDGSRENVEAFDRLPAGVRLVRHEANRGKGRAMKTALSWLAANRPDLRGVVFVDGDGQHRVSDAVAVARRMTEGDRIVFGVRDFRSSGVPFRSWWGNRWTAIEVRLLFGYRLDDTQTGLRAVPARLFAALLAVPGERFEYEAGWFPCLHALHEPIETVSIATTYVAANRASHFRPFRDTLLTQCALFRTAGIRKMV